MPSPQSGADNPRLCSAGSKAEVMSNFARYWEQSMTGEIQPEPVEQLMQRKADAYIKSRLRIINREASFQPTFQIVGPHLPHYTDDRSRVRLGRFGHRISD